MTNLLELAKRCEAAEGADRRLDLAIAALPFHKNPVPAASVFGDGGLAWHGICGMEVKPYTTSFDAAMTLLPEKAANIDIFSHTRDGGKEAWSAKFNDRAQTMGRRAAKEEIARLLKRERGFADLRGEPLVRLEKAIAEHWLEFYATAATPALALCAAALRARAPSSPNQEPEQ